MVLGLESSRIRTLHWRSVPAAFMRLHSFTHRSLSKCLISQLNSNCISLINSIRKRKAELEANLPRFPHSAFLAFVEAKISPANNTHTPNLTKHRFVPYSYPYSDDSSGIVCYSAV